MAAARELTAMKIAHEVSLKSITASYEASIKDLNAEHVQAISDIGRAHDTKIKTAVAKLREENTELKKGNTAKVTEAVRSEREQSSKTVKELEKQRRKMPRYSKDKRHPGKMWYIRYAVLRFLGSE